MEETKGIYIKWLDACFQTNPLYKEDFKEEYIVETIGIFIRETSKYVTICQDIFAGEHSFRYTKHIPKVLIIKRKWLH